ncbi:MAG: hypothetical protein JWN04_6839, partial [Myxococcaceae bacterium]|nr:hypothetical protein [Myxococcaceae bacterium]
MIAATLTNEPLSADAPEGAPRPEPPSDALSRWAYHYVNSSSLAYKLAPAPLPSALEAESTREPLRLLAPGRPRELCVTWDKYKAPRSAEALRDPKKRAHLLHTF